MTCHNFVSLPLMMTDDNNLSDTLSASKIQNILNNSVYCFVLGSDLSITDLVGQRSSCRVCFCVVAESPFGPHAVIWKMRTALCISVASCSFYCGRLYLFLWLHGLIVPNYSLGSWFSCLFEYCSASTSCVQTVYQRTVLEADS